MARKVVSISLDDDTYQLLQKIVEKRRSSVSGVIRELIYRMYISMMNNQELERTDTHVFAEYLNKLVESINELNKRIILLQNNSKSCKEEYDLSKIRMHLSGIRSNVNMMSKYIMSNTVREYLVKILKHVKQLEDLLSNNKK